MEYTKTGIVVITEKYNACVDFYKNVIQLKATGEEIKGAFKMTRFEVGTSYILVETGGKAIPAGKKVSENPCVLRFDVENIGQVLKHLLSFGLEANFYDWDWGKIITVCDPDGNRIEFKEPKQ